MNHIPLVLCADDYAISPAVNEGILHLARLGHITATSVMTLSPHWPPGAAPLRALKTQLDIGLHLDFTSPFAMHQGYGHSLRTLMLKSIVRALPQATLKRAIEEQLDAFEKHCHAPPDHVDGHQHVHQFPLIRDALLEVLSRRYPRSGKRPWLRIARVATSPDNHLSPWQQGDGAKALSAQTSGGINPSTACLAGAALPTGPTEERARQWNSFRLLNAKTTHTSPKLPKNLLHSLKAKIINGMGAAPLQALAQKHGFAYSSCLSGVYDFQGGAARYQQYLGQWLRHVRPHSVLMCHPGNSAQEDIPFPAARLWEQQVLQDPNFPALLQACHVRLVRGSQLFGQSP